MPNFFTFFWWLIFFVVHLLVDVKVLLGVYICELTIGEYLNSLTIPNIGKVGG